jgi:hypothetical protein
VVDADADGEHRGEHRGERDVDAVPRDHCPGRKTPCLRCGKRPARPYKTATENRFTVENVKAT